MTRSLVSRLGASALAQVREQLTPKAATRDPVEFTMPIPPSVNHLFATVNGRRVKSRHYAAWLREAAATLSPQRPRHVGGDVAVFLSIHRDSALSDIDNRLKGCLDSIVAFGIIDDDKHVVEIHAKWSKTENTCSVRIEPR